MPVEGALGRVRESARAAPLALERAGRGRLRVGKIRRRANGRLGVVCGRFVRRVTGGVEH